MKKSIVCILLAILFTIGSFPYGISEDNTVYAASNEEIIFEFLKNNVGLNTAAACGVLANIEKESGFRNDVIEYGYTWESGGGYGICQWTNSNRGANGRRTNLVNWCTKNGYDYTTLIGQLNYLKYELNTSYYYKWVTSKLLAVPNTADGAYEAGRVWCYYYEVPAGYKTVSVTRGNIARDKYWPKYSSRDAVNVGDDFYAYIKNPATNMLVTADGMANGSNICLRSETGQQNQIWRFIRTDDGSYSIRSAQNVSMCMDVSGYGTTNGTNVNVWSYSGNTAQKWFITGTKGNYNLRAKCASTVLDVYGGNSAEGTNIQMYQPNGSVAQKFDIVKLDSPNARYYLDVNGILNGESKDVLGAFGTFDVSVNGVKVADDVNDFWQRIAEGSSYQLSDLKGGSGCGYHGVESGSLSGTIKGDTTVVLKYDNVYKINIHGTVDGKAVDSLKGIAVFDVAINGTPKHSYVYEYEATNKHNSEYSILNVTPSEGYEFDEENSVNLSGILTSDADVYLAFKKANAKVRYDANGGTGAPEDYVIKDSDIDINGTALIFISSDVPVREGYKFVGWSTSKDGSSTVHKPGGIYFADSSVTFYAVWEELKIVSVSIESLPQKTEYETGESFDPSGMIIIVEYNDGTVREITEGFEITGFDSSEAGKCVVSVKAGNAEVYFGVTVRDAKPGFMLGDVNNDKAINALDATQILRYANNKSSVLGEMDDVEKIKRADVNADGFVNALDATQILRFANNKSSALSK